MNGGVSLSRAANACDSCRQAHAACDSARPCGRCVATGRGHLCEQTTTRRKRGRPPKQQPTDQLSFSLNTHIRTTPPSSAPYQQEHECAAMEAKRARGSPEPAKNDMTSSHQQQQQPYPSTAAPTSVVGASSSGNMVDSVVSLLIDEIKELKLVVRQQKEENDRLCTRLSKLEEKVTLQNRKIDSLLRDSPASSPSSGAPTPPQVPSERRRGGIPLIVSSFLPLPMPVHVRQVRHQILKFLPFLADYGIANPAVPFVLDDLRKPFAVLLSKPKEDSCSKNSPVYLFANQAYCEQLGYSLNELIGRSLTLVTYPDEKLDQLVNPHLRQTSPVRLSDILVIETPGIRKDGKIVSARARLQFLYDETGLLQFGIHCVDSVSLNFNDGLPTIEGSKVEPILDHVASSADSNDENESDDPPSPSGGSSSWGEDTLPPYYDIKNSQNEYTGFDSTRQQQQQQTQQQQQHQHHHMVPPSSYHQRYQSGQDGANYFFHAQTAAPLSGNSSSEMSDMERAASFENLLFSPLGFGFPSRNCGE